MVNDTLGIELLISYYLQLIEICNNFDFHFKNNGIFVYKLNQNDKKYCPSNCSNNFFFKL